MALDSRVMIVSFMSSRHDVPILADIYEPNLTNPDWMVECVTASEFHDPAAGFHQVDLIFRARLLAPGAGAAVADPAGVVNRLRWLGPAELARVRFKPDCLGRIAFGPDGPVVYDALETLVR